MKKTFKLLLLGVVVTLFAVPLVQLQAQSNGLGITPRKDYTVEPGKKIEDRLYISNLSQSQELSLDISVVDFSAQDETGTPALEQNENAEPTPYSARNFIEVQNEATIAPGKSVQLPITITVPAEQGAGSYYSAIKYQAKNVGGNEVSLTASSATLVFIKVPGEAKQLLTLQQFGAYESSESGEGSFRSLFFSSKPQELAYRLTNEGNVAEQPSGSILIKNIFGTQVASIDQANPKKSIALLGQTRRFQVCVEPQTQKVKDQSGQEFEVDVCRDPDLKPGRYTAEMTLLYGENGNNTQEISATAVFWYLPFWFIASVVGGLIALIAAGTLVYRKIKHRKRSR